jgi:predicted amidophosphoribosyltransferase
MALIFCPDCGKSISDSAETCIDCGRPMQNKRPPVQPELAQAVFDSDLILSPVAYRKEHLADRLGVGCIVQAVGLGIMILTFFTVIGPVIGLAMLFYGGSVSRQKTYTCDNCGNYIAPTSTICPTCQSCITDSPGKVMMDQVKATVLTVSSLVLIFLIYFYKP